MTDQPHRITWFHPDRPVDGGTTYVRPADGEDDAEVWIPPVQDCLDHAHAPCPHCDSRVWHMRTNRCGDCGRRPTPKESTS